MSSFQTKDVIVDGEERVELWIDGHFVTDVDVLSVHTKKEIKADLKQAWLDGEFKRYEKN